MSMDKQKIQNSLEKMDSIEDLLKALVTASSDYNVALRELLKESEVNGAIKSVLERLNVSMEDFEKNVEELDVQREETLTQELKEEADSLKDEMEQHAEEVFDSPNESRFKKLMAFNPDGDISDLFNAIKKEDLKRMKKYSIEEMENMYLLMDQNQKTEFESELKDMKFKQGLFSGQKLDDDYFKKLKELDKDFEEYRDFNNVSIEDFEEKRLTAGAKTLLQKEFEEGVEGGDDEKSKRKEIRLFQNQAREETFNELFNVEVGYNQKPMSIFNKDGKKVAKRTPFGTYCTKDASMEDVYASFVSHVNKPRYKKTNSKKLRKFTIQLPADEAYSTKVVEQVLVKMVEEGLVERRQLKLPSPYDQMLKNRLDERKLELGIDENEEPDNPERAVEHDAKLENGGEKQTPSGQEPSTTPENNGDDVIKNSLNSLNAKNDLKDDEKALVEKMMNNEGYTKEKAEIVLDIFKNIKDEKKYAELLIENPDELLKEIKESYAKDQKALVKEVLDSKEGQYDENFLKNAKSSMFASAVAEKESKVFEKADYEKSFDNFVEEQNKLKQEAASQDMANEDMSHNMPENDNPFEGMQEQGDAYPDYSDMPPHYDDMPPHYDDMNQNFDDMPPHYEDMGHNMPTQESTSEPVPDFDPDINWGDIFDDEQKNNNNEVDEPKKSKKNNRRPGR